MSAGSTPTTPRLASRYVLGGRHGHGGSLTLLQSTTRIEPLRGHLDCGVLWKPFGEDERAKRERHPETETDDAANHDAV